MANKISSFATTCAMLGVLVFSLTGCGPGCSCGCCGDKCKDCDKCETAKKNEGQCGCQCCSKCCSENKGVENKVSGDTKMTNIGGGVRQKSVTGLEWEVIKAGEGVSPKAGQTVVVHYTGWINENGARGKKFDSSVDRGVPFKFNVGVGQVIKGWDEGVISMKEGEKRILYIPSGLAYGKRGFEPVIKPNADLIFEVELFEIK